MLEFPLLYVRLPECKGFLSISDLIPFVASKTPFLSCVVKTTEPRKRKNSYFPLYWLVNRDPYNGLFPLYWLVNRDPYNGLL